MEIQNQTSILIANLTNIEHKPVVGDLIYGSDTYYAQITRVGESVVEFTVIGQIADLQELYDYIDSSFDDITANIAFKNQSNVFTQPQQVPNATLPQHATNKLQVETMFEMFKQQLRGYNLAMPDLNGKAYLGGGWYQIQLEANYDRRYNVNTGEWYMDGVFPSLFAGSEAISFEIDALEDYVLKPVLISGTHNHSYDFIFWTGPQGFMSINSEQTRNINNSNVLRWRSNIDGLVYNNAIIKFQLEKGSTATPYTVPGQIPQYKIVGEA